MVEFERGETVQLDVYWKNRNGSEVTPSSQSLVITDPDGETTTPVTNPTLVVTGHYYYDYDLPDDCSLGTWTVRWEGVISGKDYVKVGSFEVKEFKLRPS